MESLYYADPPGTGVVLVTTLPTTDVPVTVGPEPDAVTIAYPFAPPDPPLAPPELLPLEPAVELLSTTPPAPPLPASFPPAPPAPDDSFV